MDEYRDWVERQADRLAETPLAYGYPADWHALDQLADCEVGR